MQKSPHYRFQIANAVSSIELVFSSISPSSVVAEVSNEIGCPFHAMLDDQPFLDNRLESGICFFCEVACIFNRFTKKVEVPVPMP